ncbi:MAG: hypothetical protein Q8K58_00320 [Acidimicrobiales bacterium]|jgi:predicted pyridoxine 5'-phosphate oxidase superfamily flavin-nucleotide-binding protein|nr:hypothetical protein [Acidimicrobiales bacterium]
MGHDTITVIDEHAVLACSTAEANIHLSGPAAVAAWFGARCRPDRTTVDIGDTTLGFRHQKLEWHPDQQAVTVDGTVNGLHYQAHLTLRRVIRPGVDGDLHEATEVWAHVELTPARSAAPTARTIRAVLRRGLDHLRRELDASPYATR